MSDTAISPAAGTVVVTGNAPIVKRVILIPSATSVGVTGNAPSTATFEPAVCSPGAGSVAVTSYAPRLEGWADLSESATTWTNL